MEPSQQQRAPDDREGQDGYAPEGIGHHSPVARGTTGSGGDIPSKVGKYQVTKWLGSGGMGEVWLAEDEFGNEVAVKLFSATGPSRDSFLRMFMREAHTLSMLQHRNICRIYGVEEHESRPFIIMEYVRGVDLGTLMSFLSQTARPTESGRHPPSDLRTIISEVERQIRRPEGPERASGGSPRSVTQTRTLPLQQALSIVIRLCDAVQYAHERGVFHRDIKPSNIVLRSDGEPVLLDFGVAKLAGKSVKESFTQTGQILGTIDYMAPEQEASSRTIDERADVYSIGAVLYELVTGRRFFLSTGSLLSDLERLRDYVPVRPRAHSRHIDRELQDIILKAVAADKEQRYRSVRSLAQDLVRYQDGQPIIAKPPTPWYLASKFVRRNALGVALSGVILALSVALSGYYAVDYYRAWGSWIPALEHDFVTQPRLGGQFVFYDTVGVAERPWVVDSGGLLLARHEWCWLRDVRVSGNVRVVMRLHYDNMPDGFEVAINSADDSVGVWYDVPRGYSCQIGGYQGTLDFISVNKTPGVARTANPVPSRIDSERDVEVIFQREGERVSLVVNGRKQVDERDLLPFWGSDFSRIGFRSFASMVHVRSIAVYRMSLPQKASPLIAGDILASLNYPRDAIKTYLSIAEDYRGMSLSEKALARSLHVIYSLAEPFKSHLSDSVLSVYKVELKNSSSWNDIRGMQVQDLWRSGRFNEALRELPGILEADPANRIAAELQYVGSHGTVPDSVSHRLFLIAAKSGGVRCLTGAGMPASALTLVRGLPLGYLRWTNGLLNDLSPLASSRLTWLAISTNRIEDITPLWGQPLTYLSCSFNRINSLQGLANAPLRILFAGTNRIGDLSPLRYCPLEALDVSENMVGDLSPLAGKSIRFLSCSANRISSLGPLEDMPLRVLNIADNRVGSLAPIRRAPLTDLQAGWNAIGDLVPLTGGAIRSLDISYNRIESLEPLGGMPLRELSCAYNRISSIEPLRNIALRTLDISGNAVTDLSALAGMPLEVLDISGNAVSDFAPVLRLRLSALRCGGNPRLPLAAVRNLPLRTLGIDRSSLRDLWPVTGMQLSELDCRQNTITDLSALAGMPLQSLNCSDNRIGSLDALAGAPLTSVRCARNAITSLEPLRGKIMQVIDCSDNPIRSLAPVIANPPATFLFFTRTLPPSELLRAAAVWDGDTLLRGHARNARILAALNAHDYGRLRAMALDGPAASYLYIPWELGRRDAAEICEATGGSFPRLDSDDEWFHVRDTFGLRLVPTLWAGVVDRGQGPQWENGGGAPTIFVDHGEGGSWVYTHNGLRRVPGVTRAGLLIQFDKTIEQLLQAGATPAARATKEM